MDWGVYGRTSRRVCRDRQTDVQNYRIQFSDMKRQIRFAEVRHEKSLGS